MCNHLHGLSHIHGSSEDEQHNMSIDYVYVHINIILMNEWMNEPWLLMVGRSDCLLIMFDGP